MKLFKRISSFFKKPKKTARKEKGNADFVSENWHGGVIRVYYRDKDGRMRDVERPVRYPRNPSK